MNTIRSLTYVLVLLVATAAAAQPLDIFVPDDFVDPEQTRGRMIFASRLIVGYARGANDQYRPLGQDIGFVHVANSLYWSGFQLDYEHSEVRGENDWGSRRPSPRDNDFRDVVPCEPVNVSPPICLAPTNHIGESDASPVPAPKDLVQLGWSHGIGSRAIFRYQVAYGRQYAIPRFGEGGRGEDHDDTRAVNIEAGIRAGRRMLHGAVSYTELTHRSAVPETKQQTVTVTAFLPLLRIGPAILTPRLQVGDVLDTGPAVDIINPSLDLALYVPRARANVHLVYSPVIHDTGEERATQHQVAMYIDRALLVTIFGR